MQFSSIIHGPSADPDKMHASSRTPELSNASANATSNALYQPTEGAPDTQLLGSQPIEYSAPAQPANTYCRRTKDLLVDWAASWRRHSHYSAQPSWYKPLRLLLVFCYVMLLTWLDQGSFASNGVQGDWRSDGDAGSPGLIIDLDINPFQDGVLGAMYTVGLILASFAFATQAHHVNEFRLIGVGMVVWALGCIFTALAPMYAAMIVARMLVGAGEASVVTLTFPFVDDVAPSKYKTLWFGILALCQPVGTALGYVVGGAIAVAAGWRNVFFIEAGLAVPFIAFALLMPAVQLQNNGAAASRPTEGHLQQQALCDVALELSSPRGEGDSIAGEPPSHTEGQVCIEADVEHAAGQGFRPGGPKASSAAAKHAAADENLLEELLDQGTSQDEADTETLAGPGTSSYDGTVPTMACGGGQEPSVSCQSQLHTGPGGLYMHHPAPRAALREWLVQRWQDMRVLHSHPAWVYNNYAYIPVEFMLQTFAYWAPRAGHNMFDRSTDEVDLTFGAIAVVAGVLGSIGGGLCLDYFGSSFINSFRLMLLATVIGTVLLEVPFAVTGISYTPFCVIISFAILSLVWLTAMSYGVSMWSVPPEYRAHSQAVLTISQRLLGDLPAPPVVGAMQGALGNWHHTFAIITVVMVLAIALYTLGWLSAGSAVDYREAVLPITDPTTNSTATLAMPATGAGKGNISHEAVTQA